MKISLSSLWNWGEMYHTCIEFIQEKNLAEEYKTTWFVVVYLVIGGLSAAFLSAYIARWFWPMYLFLGILLLVLSAAVYYKGGVKPQEMKIKSTNKELNRIRRIFSRMQKRYNELREEFLTQDHLLKHLRRKKAELERAQVQSDPEISQAERDQLAADLLGLSIKIDGAPGDSATGKFAIKGKLEERNAAREAMRRYDDVIIEVLKEGGRYAKVDAVGNLKMEGLERETFLELIDFNGLLWRFQNTSGESLSDEEKEKGDENSLSEDMKSVYNRLSNKDKNCFLRLSPEDRSLFCALFLRWNDLERRIDEYFEETPVEGLSALNKISTLQEDDLVIKYYAPFVLSFIISGFVAIFFFASIIDLANIGFLNKLNQAVYEFTWLVDNGTSWFGTISRLILPFVIIAVAIYLSQSFEKVKVTEKCVGLFLNRPFGEFTSGWRFMPRYLTSLLNFPITLQYYNILRDEVMLKGDESQSFWVNVSVPYFLEKMRDIIRRLGMSKKEIRRLLENIEVDEKTGEIKIDPHLGKGIIGDKVSASVRAFTAGRLDTLDEALMMRENLAEEILTILKEDLGDLGIFFGRVVVTGVDPDETMVEERNKRAIAQVKVYTTQHEAKAAIRRAEGEAAATLKIGTAKADVIRLQGNAEAAVALAMRSADIDAIAYLKKQAVAPEKVVALITAAVIGQKTWTDVSRAMKEMKINLYAIPKLDEIISLVSSKLGIK